MAKYKLYDTKEKRERFLNRQGNIVTFKKKFIHGFSHHSQIIVEKLEYDKKKVRIVGFAKITPWFANMEALIKAVDWAQMEKWHIW